KRQPFQRGLWHTTKGTPSERSEARCRGGRGSTGRPERGSWQSERLRVPRAGSPRPPVGTVGTHGPRDPLEGRRRRASRYLEGPLGETPGSPTVSRKLQSIATQAKRSPAMVLDNVLLKDCTK